MTRHIVYANGSRSSGHIEQLPPGATEYATPELADEAAAAIVAALPPPPPPLDVRIRALEMKANIGPADLAAAAAALADEKA